MQYFNPPCQCLNCHSAIVPQVFRHSINYLGYPLCNRCEVELKPTLRHMSRETKKLYFSLKRRGVPAAFEGRRKIDIDTATTQLNIEVDGPGTSYHPGTALAELQQAFFGFKDGQLHIRIPSALVAYHLEETADYITCFLNESGKRAFFPEN